MVKIQRGIIKVYIHYTSNKSNIMCCVNSSDSIQIMTRLRFRSNASNHFRPSQGSLMYPNVEIPIVTIPCQTKQSLHVYRLSQCDKTLQATSQTNQTYPLFNFQKGPGLYKCIIPKKNLTSSLFFRPGTPSVLFF